MSELDDVARELGEKRFVDRRGLGAATKERVLAAIRAASANALTAYVVVLPDGAALAPWHPLFAQLRLDPKRDLLLLFDGARWEARGWGLGPERIAGVLVRAEATLHTDAGRGLAEAIERLSAAARGVPFAALASPDAGGASPRGAEGASYAPLAWGVAAAGTLGVVGWVIARRMRRASERKKSLKDVVGSAERAHAELMLAAEELPREQASDVQLRAVRLGQELESAAAAAGRAADERVALARIEQIESEIAALESEVLQKKGTYS